jgi:hypothetical protein
LRNISTPVTTVLVFVDPHDLHGVAGVDDPCSTRPVATVPRPVIEKTPSIGIKKGLSSSRTGSGM